MKPAPSLQLHIVLISKLENFYVFVSGLLCSPFSRHRSLETFPRGRLVLPERLPRGARRWGSWEFPGGDSSRGSWSTFKRVISCLLMGSPLWTVIIPHERYRALGLQKSQQGPGRAGVPNWPGRQRPQKVSPGAPWWHSRLRIWYCHCSGSGHCPGPGTSTCRRCSQNKTKKNRNRR